MRLSSFPFVVFVVSIALAQAPKVTEPYSLRLSAPAAAAVAGTPMKIEVTLENTSAEDLVLLKSRGSGELTYEVAVVTTAGSPAPLTPYGKALHGQPTRPVIIYRVSPQEIILKPREKVVDVIPLDKIYQLTPGDYIVRVQKKQLDSRPEPSIASNTLKLTILPRNE